MTSRKSYESANEATANPQPVSQTEEPEFVEVDKRIIRSGWADVRFNRLALRSTRQWLVLTDVALFIYKEKEMPPRSWPLYAISDADIDVVGALTSHFGRHSLELGTRRSGPTPARKFFVSFKSTTERDNWVRALALVRKSVLVLAAPTAPVLHIASPSDEAISEPPLPPLRSILKDVSHRPPQLLSIGSSTTVDTATSVTDTSSRRTSYSWRGRRKRTISDAPRRQSAVSSFVSFANTSVTSLVTIASGKSVKSRLERETDQESIFTLDFDKFQPMDELLNEEGISVGNPLDLTGSVTRIGAWPVGGGGYADVWKGKWTVKGTSRPVAIKVIRTFAVPHPPSASQQGSGLDEPLSKEQKIARRLQQELIIWHQLRHPHIVSLWGTVADFGPYPSFVSPWMRNGNAWEWIKEKDIEETRQKRLKLLLEVALALEFIHTRSPPIVHGDLKACNILINDNEEACLADFGLSTIMSEAAGVSPASLSAHVGSTRYLAFELVVPPYRPPRPQSPRSTTTRRSTRSNRSESPAEEAEEGPVSENIDWHETPPCTRASDVWAFGSTAYELLSGRAPYYHRVNDTQVLFEIIMRRRPQRQGTVIPPHIWSWMEQSCWAENPRDRPDMTSVVSTMRMYVEAYRHGLRLTQSTPRRAKRALPLLPTLTRQLSQSSGSTASTTDKSKQVLR